MMGFHPLAGKLICKAKDGELPKRVSSFHPLAGKLICKGGCDHNLAQLIPGVSIPLRGSWFVKSFLFPSLMLGIVVSFHPLAGKLICKEFTSGNFTEQGFYIPQSTHLFLVRKNQCLLRKNWLIQESKALLQKQSTQVNEFIRFSRFGGRVSMFSIQFSYIQHIAINVKLLTDDNTFAIFP